MADSTYKFVLQVPRRVEWRGPGPERRTFERDDFFAFMWELFGDEAGLAGIDEGTMLSQEAFEQGFETESFTVDAGAAPRERDWLQSLESQSTTLYFSTQPQAHAARDTIRAHTGLEAGEIAEQPNEDWDANWRAQYRGVDLPPFWEVRPPWYELPADGGAGRRLLRLNPGAGFGTGTHETTQLCLTALHEILVDAKTGEGRDARVLDFGSGSGILSIGAALCGARVDGVEIDPLAIDNARDNSELNGVSDRIRYTLDLSEAGAGSAEYDVVVANILRPVLLEFAERLVARLRPGGRVVLSGLVEEDLTHILTRFSPLVAARDGRAAEIRRNGDWRAVIY